LPDRTPKNNEPGLVIRPFPRAETGFDPSKRPCLIAPRYTLGFTTMVKFVVEYGRDTDPPAADGRLDGPTFHRNHEPIWSAVSDFLSTQTGNVLEIGSGTGQHVTEFARRSKHLNWWPSDIYDSHLKSIAAWREHSRLENLNAPQRIASQQAQRQAAQQHCGRRPLPSWPSRRGAVPPWAKCRAHRGASLYAASYAAYPRVQAGVRIKRRRLRSRRGLRRRRSERTLR